MPGIEDVERHLLRSPSQFDSSGTGALEPTGGKPFVPLPRRDRQDVLEFAGKDGQLLEVCNLPIETFSNVSERRGFAGWHQKNDSACLDTQKLPMPPGQLPPQLAFDPLGSDR